MYTIPQSPRWLSLRGREGEAKASLRTAGRGGCRGHARASSRAPRTKRVRRGAGAVLARVTAGRSCSRSCWRCSTSSPASTRSSTTSTTSSPPPASTRCRADLQAIAIGAANLIATMIALRVIDKFGRKKLLLIGAIGTAVAQAGVALIMGSGEGQRISACDADHVHRVLRVLAGRGDLGVSRRDFSDGGARARAGAGQHHALAHERAHRARCFR